MVNAYVTLKKVSKKDKNIVTAELSGPLSQYVNKRQHTEFVIRFHKGYADTKYDIPVVFRVNRAGKTACTSAWPTILDGLRPEVGRTMKVETTGVVAIHDLVPETTSITFSYPTKRSAMPKTKSSTKGGKLKAISTRSGVTIVRS
jgi:hypothetical protein